MKDVVLSLILPCYNEAEHFEISAKHILDSLSRQISKCEVIFVEDKSKDATKKMLQFFIDSQKESYNVHAIFHTKNEGRGKSVRDGILNAKGTYAGFIDIDCEISPSYIHLFLDKLKQGYDVACAKRIYKISPGGLVRAFASKIYALLVRMLLNAQTPDTEAGYKFFKRVKILPVLKRTRDPGWFWDTEIILRAERAGLKIASVPVLFRRRGDKTSTVDLLQDTLEYIKKIWQFRTQVKTNI